MAIFLYASEVTGCVGMSHFDYKLCIESRNTKYLFIIGCVICIINHCMWWVVYSVLIHKNAINLTRTEDG